MTCVFCGAETDASNGAEEFAFRYSIVDETGKIIDVFEWLVCVNCVSQTKRKCTVCNTEYTLNRDDLFHIKSGIISLLVLCPTCFTKGLGGV